MTSSALQDRIRDDDQAFSGLLSLIPAKMYFGEDTSDQWQRKKQTKEQAKAAKRGRLDPDSALNRNAKEVMDERARAKRKLDDLEDEDDESVNKQAEHTQDEGIERERPGEGMKKTQVDEPSIAKKPRLSDSSVPAEKAKEQAKTEKEQRREAKKLKKAEKKRLKAAKAAARPAVERANAASTELPSTEVDETTRKDESEMNAIDVPGLISKDDEAISSKSDSGSASRSPLFDSEEKNQPVDSSSTATSTSSTAPASDRPKPLVIPQDTTLLRARLAAKIEQLRARRKADGADGKPIRTRQELIESRRVKQAQRKAHKKEMRRLAKEEEDRRREEALSSARNSPGSILSPLVDEAAANNFAFGRVNFTDGTQMSYDLSYEKKTDKKKGPSDPKTALLKLEAQKQRIAGLDADKRKEVLEKETWVAARKRAEGEKVRDDEALLKKALKRKEKTKKKSEREWKERAKGVEDAIKARQHKREENLRKRKEEKHAGKGKKGPAAKKSRPGFEGSFGVGKRR